MEKLPLGQEMGNRGLRWIGNTNSTMKEQVTRSTLLNSNSSKIPNMESLGKFPIVEDKSGDLDASMDSHVSKCEHYESRQLRELHKLDTYAESLNQQRISLGQKLDRLLLHFAQHPSNNTHMSSLEQKRPPDKVSHSRTSDSDEKLPPSRPGENFIKLSGQAHSTKPSFDLETLRAMNDENSNRNGRLEQEPNLDTISKMVHIDENSNRNVDESDYTPSQSTRSAIVEFSLHGSPISRQYQKELPKRTLTRDTEYSETELSRRLLTQIEYVESLEKAQARLLVLGNRMRAPLISSTREKRKLPSKIRRPNMIEVSMSPAEFSSPVDLEKSSSQELPTIGKPSSFSPLAGTSRDPQLAFPSKRVSSFSRRITLSSHPSRPPIDEYEEMKQRQLLRTLSTDKLWQNSPPNDSRSRPISSRFVSVESMKTLPISRELPIQDDSETSIENPSHSKITKTSSSFDPERTVPLESINVVALSQLPDEMLLEAIKLKIAKMKLQLTSKQTKKSISKFEKAQAQLEERQQTRHRDRLTNSRHSIHSIPSSHFDSSLSHNGTSSLDDRLSDTTVSSSNHSRTQFPSATTILARGKDDQSSSQMMATQSELLQEAQSFASQPLNTSNMTHSSGIHHIGFLSDSERDGLTSIVYDSMFPHVNGGMKVPEDRGVSSIQTSKYSMKLYSSERMDQSIPSPSPSSGTESKQSQSQEHRPSPSDAYSTFKFDNSLDSLRMSRIPNESPDSVHKRRVS